LPTVSLLACAAFVLSPAVLAQDANWSSQSKKKKSTTKKPGNDAQAAVNPTEPQLIGQYGEWGAYMAAPDGKKVCFALSKPTAQKASKEDVKRDQAYIFVATRPAESVKDEVSVIVGYPLDPKVDATAQVGSEKFAMFGQADGAWIKNAAEEPELVEAMRKGSELVIKGKSSRGTETTDTYSLMGVTNALERVAKECGSSG
jgi:hypothetical protein